MDSDAIAKLNIYQKLAAITGEVGVVKKGGRNQEQGYSFIEYAAVAGELRSLFWKYGVVVVPRMQSPSKQRHLDITSKGGKAGYYVQIEFYFTIVNADNPDDHFNVSWTGEAADFGDKATNKAATSALKYYLMRQFNISEKGEEEADASTPEIAASKTPAKAKAPARASDSQLEFIHTLAFRKGKDLEWIALYVDTLKSSN
jgi:hypothetical protein